MSPNDKSGFDQGEYDRPAAKPTRPIEYVEVPAGTRVAECSGHRRPGGSCRAPIYWIERVSLNKKTPGKIVKIPVDCDHNEQCVAPTATEDGLGANHYMTCPDANRF